MIRSYSHSLRAHEPLRRRAAGRAAFTLVELLVVVAIIALLVAITTAGVFKVFGKRPDVADMHDIKELEESIGNFYAKWNAKVYPPDTIKLCHYLNDYDQNNPLDKASVQILLRIWPKLFNFSVSASAAAPNNQPVAWAGYDKSTWTYIPLPQHPITKQNCVVLQGDQCLVFFLGGVGGVHGFNESTTFPIDPMDHPKFTNKQANPIRFYEFLKQGSRLVPRYNNVPSNAFDMFLPDDTIWPVPTPNHPFPSFMDNYEKLPIVYFVGGNRKLYNELAHNAGSPIVGIPILGVQPYHKNFDAKGRPQNYYNPSTFQIITAGLDHKFGGPGQWDNALSNVPGEDWKDNRANFHPNHLGVAQ